MENEAENVFGCLVTVTQAFKATKVGSMIQSSFTTPFAFVLVLC